MNTLFQWGSLIKTFKNLVFVVVCFLLIPITTKCQETGPYRTRLSIEAEQFLDNTILVNVKLLAKTGKSYTPVKNVEIDFYDVGKEESKLGSSITNNNGIIEFWVKDRNALNTNEDGYYVISTSFKGNATYKPKEKDIEFKGANIVVEATEEDSVKVILIKAFETDSMLPLSEQTVTIVVPRLFTNLMITEVETDENGEVSLIFPSGVPVNVGNNLEIKTSLLETDDYATVSTVINKEWGVANPVIQERSSRELWSPNAPLWMVITFAIMMIAVWGHFIIIAYKLYLVNKDGIS